LAPHLGKPIYMLSTGSGRKLGWVAACASGAPVTVLDTPFAALDALSVRALTQRLRQAAQDTQRAWLLGDHECPEGLADVPWAGQIDLGD
jgi:ABC-type nitrate/sulfonate/bicarbonate transport system ATPase subunit